MMLCSHVHSRSFMCSSQTLVHFVCICGVFVPSWTRSHLGPELHRSAITSQRLCSQLTSPDTLYHPQSYNITDGATTPRPVPLIPVSSEEQLVPMYQTLMQPEIEQSISRPWSEHYIQLYRAGSLELSF